MVQKGCIILTHAGECLPSRAETPYPYQFLTHWQSLANQESSSPFPPPISLNPV